MEINFETKFNIGDTVYIFYKHIESKKFIHKADICSIEPIILNSGHICIRYGVGTFLPIVVPSMSGLQLGLKIREECISYNLDDLENLILKDEQKSHPSNRTSYIYPDSIKKQINEIKKLEKR